MLASKLVFPLHSLPPLPLLPWQFCVNIDTLDLDLDENDENLPQSVDRYAKVRPLSAGPTFPPSFATHPSAHPLLVFLPCSHCLHSVHPRPPLLTRLAVALNLHPSLCSTLHSCTMLPARAVRCESRPFGQDARRSLFSWDRRRPLPQAPQTRARTSPSKRTSPSSRRRWTRPSFRTSLKRPGISSSTSERVKYRGARQGVLAQVVGSHTCSRTQPYAGGCRTTCRCTATILPTPASTLSLSRR